jgi:polar amino acid transport system substrate-binding protein
MDTLKVGAAFPDPPFNGSSGDGLDIDLMTEIATALGMGAAFIAYEGADFNGIFDALNSAAFDCVTSGTTVTPQREQKAAFCAPYLISGQSLTIGVQHGNTSQPIAEELVRAGRAGRVRVYDYGSIRRALSDLSTGGCDVFMKLAPVLTALVRPVAGVEVVQTGISVEDIAIAVPSANHDLLHRIGAAQRKLEDNGRLPQIRQAWLGNPAADQSRTVH